MRAFCRDFVNSVPDVVRVNRGKMSLDGVAEKALEVGAEKVIIVDRWHGGPGKIAFFTVTSTGLTPIPPLMLLSGIRLKREFENRTKRARSSVITIESTDSSELEKAAGQLSKFFGLPLLSSRQASEQHKASMHLSFDSSSRLQLTFMLLGRMVEIGPRVTVSKLVWEAA